MVTQLLKSLTLEGESKKEHFYVCFSPAQPVDPVTEAFQFCACKLDWGKWCAYGWQISALLPYSEHIIFKEAAVLVKKKNSEEKSTSAKPGSWYICTQKCCVAK